tara:strand:+ start:577 stop:1002 length:426 start_codon:yes stop_codon:yes gene_type:complete
MNSPKSDEPLNITNILSNLKLLSNIPIGSKLAIRNNEIVIHNKDSWQDSMVRFYNRDSRNQAIWYLDEFIKDISKLLLHPNVSDTAKQRIKCEINQCTQGLGHLKNTYYSDISTRTKIETLIENLNNISYGFDSDPVNLDD